MLTQDFLNSLLRYEPETGKLFWKPRDKEMFRSDRQFKTWNTRFSEKEAGSVGNHGYRAVIVMGKAYLAHRLIWMMVYGDWPPEQLDHINGDRQDNRLSNIRRVSNAENCKNLGMKKDNSSGITGVSWRPDINKWTARIRVNGKDKHLGSFGDKETAIQARKAADIKYGYHPNHGRHV